MSKKTLVIMAAGIGSRFDNKRIKQLEPIGPNGELLIDYSVYDAKKAGFERIIFIIRRDIEQLFRDAIGDRISEKIEVCYAFQEKDDIPVRKELAQSRVKPWGTGQAVLACKSLLDGPFAVINADDYYGRESFEILANHLDSGENCLVAFRIKNTLSENGTVTRGICRTEGEYLGRVLETKQLCRGENGVISGNYNGETLTVDDETPVSMNMFGFNADFADRLETEFTAFLNGAKDANDGEFLVPIVVDKLIGNSEIKVKMLYTDSKWFGMTYMEDVAEVRASVKKSIEDGFYPAELWG